MKYNQKRVKSSHTYLSFSSISFNLPFLHAWLERKTNTKAQLIFFRVVNPNGVPPVLARTGIMHFYTLAAAASIIRTTIIRFTPQIYICDLHALETAENSTQ
jgi:hypothetical protein